MSETQGTRPNPRMVLAATILGICIIVASWVQRSADVGRYQLGGVSGHLCVIDTSTGEVWETWVMENSSEFREFTKRKK